MSDIELKEILTSRDFQNFRNEINNNFETMQQEIVNMREQWNTILNTQQKREIVLPRPQDIGLQLSPPVAQENDAYEQDHAAPLPRKAVPSFQQDVPPLPQSHLPPLFSLAHHMLDTSLGK